MKPRHVFKDSECPENLMRARTDPNAIIRVSGALCEAVKLNQAWIVERVLAAATIGELQQLIHHKETGQPNPQV